VKRKQTKYWIRHLVVTGAKYELGVGILVYYPLNNFAFVDCDRSDFQILLADKKFYRTFTRQVVLQEILTLSALEETEGKKTT